jgi:fibronectin type 3 domain-containing protein
VKAFYGSQSSEQSVATQFEMDYEKPLAPLVVEAFNLNNAIVLRWGKSEIGNLKSYKIYRVNQNNDSEKLIATINATENSYTDKSVINGNEYGYYIIAVDGNGVESVKSSEVGVMVK